MKRSALLYTMTVSGLAISLIGLGGVVHAQTPPAAAQAQPDRGHGRMGPPKIGRMIGGPGRSAGPFGLLEFDANGDGKLTKAEFEAGQHARFNAIDANKDGFITPDEMVAHRKQARADAEAARFQIMDTDHNGQISKAEFEAAHALKDEHGLGRRGPGRGPLGFGPPGPDRGERHHIGGKPGDDDQRGRPGRRDASGDGKINFEEFSARGADAFARADLNKDNVVTIAELQTLTKAMR